MKFLNFLFIFSLFISCTSAPESGQLVKHPKLPNNYKICIFGDSGKNNSNQRLVAGALAKENCDQIRHLGDIIYSRGIDDANDPKFKTHFYDYYDAIIEKGIPFYLVVGNHDYQKNPSAWIDVAKKYPNIHFPGLYYLDVYQDICFISLDTNDNFITQKFWFDKIQEKELKDCKLKLAFGHHPLYSSGDRGDAHFGVRTFLNNTISETAQAYFAGHEHDLQDVKTENGTRYLISGTAAMTRKLRSPASLWGLSKLGYLTLTLQYQDQSPSFKFQFISVSSNPGETRVEHTGIIKPNQL